jgi:oxygen-independent coproporphyrinogen-3 oxidase
MSLFGVYLHFPFCRRRCPYCDFAISIWSEVPHEQYRDAILQELQHRAGEYEGRSAVSISFGGGTPSMWRPDCLSAVIGAIRQKTSTTSGLQEISLEANPEDLDDATLQGLAGAGIDRLSIGVQSFQDESLALLGRGHDRMRALDVVTKALKLFPKVSLDIICGAPRSTREQFIDDINTTAALGVSHVSVYGLTIEPKTRYAKLEKQRRLHAPNDDELADRLHLAQQLLTSRGFVQYEVSNYARPGHESLHNSLYWSGAEYLGLGCGAHSFFWLDKARALRAVNVAGASEYLRRAEQGDVTRSKEIVEGEDLLCEMVLSQIRSHGLSLSWFQDTFGVDLVQRGGRALERLVIDGKVAIDGDRLQVTSQGIFFVDDVTLALLRHAAT